MAFTAWAAAASIPLWLIVLFANNLMLIVIVNAVLYGLAILWVGPATADIHDIAGPKLRGLGIGIFFSIVNLVAYGAGAPIIGRISDKLGVATDASQMRVALLVCPLACALGEAWQRLLEPCDQAGEAGLGLVARRRAPDIAERREELLLLRR